jgi:hypothetical protein
MGDPGFDRLIVADTLLGSAYTASDQVRFAIEMHGIFASAGSPDGSSKFRFGTLPAKAVFAEQSNAGYSGLAEVSTKTFGLAVGTTPGDFAVHHVIGGVRYRPHNKWLTLLGTRESVKDSFLSYAGATDPATGVRWGGVVSNSISSQFNSAPLPSHLYYKTIGEYASVSFSSLQGTHVPGNWSAAGNAGLYWQMVQGLTLGVNVTGMHYDRNLNYFSLGQGGYFSPRQYYLASVPVSWYSRKQRLEYQIQFSGGMQYVQQDASPIFPVSPRSSAKGPVLYPATSSKTPNYDADFRLGYRLSPHLHLDMFATANNAREYYSQSVGFSLKFLIDRTPTNTDLEVSRVPDWTGKQPLAIR